MPPRASRYSGGLKSDKPTAQQYDAGLALSYELDFFGKLKNMSEADRQNFFASEEARRAVHILLVSNVSQSYFNQQLAYKQLRIAQETLKNYRQSYAFVEQQLVTGSTNVLALEQARGQIESTQAEIAKRGAGAGQQCSAAAPRHLSRIAGRQRHERQRYCAGKTAAHLSQRYCCSARILWRRSISLKRPMRISAPRAPPFSRQFP
jgi:hypothetical protein